MQSKTNGYGIPMHSFAVVSGVNRCGVASEGALQNEPPVIVPTPILRKFFDHFAPSLDSAYPKKRPELYALGSGITFEYINALEQGVEFKCNVDEYAHPCFTEEEIARLTARLSDENNMYIKLTPEEIVDYNNRGGLAPDHSSAFYTHVATEKTPEEAVYTKEYIGACSEDRMGQWGPYVTASSDAMRTLGRRCA